MRIDPDKLSRVAGKPVEPAQTPEVKPAEVEGATAPSASAQADQVVLSQRAAEIQMAKEALASVPEVRQEKVAAIKKRIEEGTYEIDGEAIAARIISGSD